METSERERRRAERITAERAQFRLRPWEFSPSEITDDPSPYPPGIGSESWDRARRWRDELRAANPEYFDDEND